MCAANLKWVGSIDLNANDQADANIVVDKDAGWVEQETAILDQLQGILDTNKLDAVICVAGNNICKCKKSTFQVINKAINNRNLCYFFLGGWAGGNANKDLAKNADMMWRQSVWSSSISATIGSRFLKPGGCLTLTGADAALGATPGMIGYGKCTNIFLPFRCIDLYLKHLK